MQKFGHQSMLAAHFPGIESWNFVVQANLQRLLQPQPNLDHDDEIVRSLIVPYENHDVIETIRMVQLVAVAMAYAINQMDYRACLVAAIADDVSKAGHFGRFVSDLQSNLTDYLHCSNPTMSWNSLNFCLFLCLVAVAGPQLHAYSMILHRF